jgi:hypothetical protein
MKPQDILFIAVFIPLLLRRDPRLLAGFGLLCLILAVPLFAAWTFFTAERLTWYAGASFLASSAIFLRVPYKVQ